MPNFINRVVLFSVTCFVVVLLIVILHVGCSPSPKIPSNPNHLKIKNTRVLCEKLRCGNVVLNVVFMFNLDEATELIPLHDIISPSNIKSVYPPTLEIDIERLIENMEPFHYGGSSAMMTAFLYYIKHGIKPIAFIAAEQWQYTTICDTSKEWNDNVNTIDWYCTLPIRRKISERFLSSDDVAYCSYESEGLWLSSQFGKYRFEQGQLEDLPSFDGGVYFIGFNETKFKKMNLDACELYKSTVRRHFMVSLAEYKKCNGVPTLSCDRDFGIWGTVENQYGFNVGEILYVFNIPHEKWANELIKELPVY
jgi:hypothetical protein